MIYASSSSVYGDNKIFPLKEKFILRPKNIYGLSKKNNEEMAQIYFNFYGLKSIGLRFFSSIVEVSHIYWTISFSNNIDDLGFSFPLNIWDMDAKVL